MIIDVAELVLKKCTITKSKESLQPGSKKYSVTFNYEFIEDKDLAKMCAYPNCDFIINTIYSMAS